MKQLLFIASTVFLFSCGTTESPKEKIEETAEEVIITENKFGEDIIEEGALTTVDFLAQFDQIAAKEVKLTATINEVCSKKGCWMVLALDAEQDMRVRFKDYGFFVPKDAAGKLATIQGVASMDTTDVATLQHYAEDAGESQEKIDAITKPEFSYVFEATGVIIQEVNAEANSN